MERTELKSVIARGENECVEFKDASIIEEYSSGLKRVVEAFAQNGNALPEFHVGPDTFTIFAKSINSGIPQKTAQKTAQKLLELIKQNPGITRKELSEKIGITEDGIKFSLNRLKQNGILRRVGPDRGGHWEIITNDSKKIEKLGYSIKNLNRKG